MEDRSPREVEDGVVAVATMRVVMNDALPGRTHRPVPAVGVVLRAVVVVEAGRDPVIPALIPKRKPRPSPRPRQSPSQHPK